METREESSAESTEGEERVMKRLRWGGDTGEKRKGGLEEKIRRI